MGFFLYDRLYLCRPPQICIPNRARGSVQIGRYNKRMQLVKINKLILGLIFVFSCTTLQAAPNASGVTDAQRKAVEGALKKVSKQAGKTITAADIQPSPIPGLLQVTSDMSVFYVSSDGKYLIIGEFLDVNKDKMQWSMTEDIVRKLRQAAIASVDPKDFIVYPATGKKIGSVVVFFDIDCGYCHKLVENIKDYSSAGIEIKILSFPRSGLNTDSSKKAIAVWCAADPAQALIDSAKGNVPKSDCKTKAVEVGYELGKQIGISGTPTLVLENGMKIPGLVSAPDLVKLIKGK